MKVLVCDDDPHNLSFLTCELQLLGCEVKQASSGCEAINLIEHETFEAVITDYVMSGGDGNMLSQFCDFKNIPCIVITGHDPEVVQSVLSNKSYVFGKVEFMKAIASLDSPTSGQFYRPLWAEQFWKKKG